MSENHPVGSSTMTLAYPSGLMAWEKWSLLIIAGTDQFFDFKIAIETLEERMTPAQSIGSFLMQAVNRSGRNVLHVAAANDAYDILQYCLDEERFTESEKRSTTMRSDFINKQDVLGLTPLHEAVMANNPNLVNCLLQTTNASTNIRDNKGQTAHDLAVKYRLHEIMQVFDIFSSDLDAAEAQAQAQAQGKNLVSNNNDNDDVTGMREMLRMKMGKRKAETVHTPGVLFPGRFFGLLE